MKFLVGDIRENKKISEFGLFQTELSDGVILKKSEILKFSEALSPIYIELIENLSLKFSNEYSISQDATRVICRRAMVPIIHCFFERLIRINKAVNYYLVRKVSAEKGLFLTPNIPENFDECIITDKFNQFII